MDYLFMTTNDKLEVVLLIIQKIFTSSSVFKSFEFNFALIKEGCWSSFSVLDRTLFQSEGPL